MDFDVEGNLGAAERSVWSMERDGRPARAVTLSRSYATSVEDVWDAVTNGERIPRWFLTVGGELELGGRYQLEGNAGGVITACEPLSHFAVTWEFGREVSWVEVHCSGDGAGGARLTLRHTHHVSEHWDEYGPGALGVGWELGLLGLAIHLAQPAAPVPDPAAFAVSPDGRAFISGSSEGWEASGRRVRNRSRRRAFAGRAHDRILHWRRGQDHQWRGCRD